MLTTGFRLEAKDVQYADFAGHDSLLDADLLVVHPGALKSLFGKITTLSDGLPRLFTDDGSDAFRELMDRRRREISALLANGKIVVAFLTPVLGVHGEVMGKGNYEPLTNYDWLPESEHHLIRLIARGTGSSITVSAKRNPFVPYYQTFRASLQYEAYFDAGTSGEAFLTNKANCPVGIALSWGRGLIVFLPPPPDEVRPEQIAGVLIQCAKPLLSGEARSAEPEWVKSIPLAGEADRTKDVKEAKARLDTAQKELDRKTADLDSLREYRDLLYESGKPLENAARKALRLLGFSAEPFKSSDMEHDIILECSEGRALAEVEGKDREAINIDKIDQLTRVVDEDFAANGKYSDGILIGNPHRLQPPDKRPDPFTEKAYIAAKRKQFILLATADLYQAAMRALAAPQDEALKRGLRNAILGAKGGRATLPPPQPQATPGHTT